MKVGIIGSGYVGLVSGACFAHIGHDVTIVDIDSEKVARINGGQLPIYEPGLEEIIFPAMASKKITVTTDYKLLSDVAVVFIAVGTPSKESGAADLTYVYKAAEKLCEYLKPESAIVLKSTVPVGTAAQVTEIVARSNRVDLYVVSNPEFLREGAAIDDFLHPDRVVVGASHAKAFTLMNALYAPLRVFGEFSYLEMSNKSAEVTKYASNCFLAVKISFMNEMAYFCSAVGADVDDIKKGIGSDKRIGPHFLNPGPGYGGSCFPKDVRALIHSAHEVSTELKIVSAAESVNAYAKIYLAKKLCDEKKMKGKSVLIWGAAFKANTDDIRESSTIDTCHYLLEKGVEKIYIYDPIAAENMKNYFKDNSQIIMTQSVWEHVSEVNSLLILTEWKEFQDVSLAQFQEHMQHKAIYDSRNLYSPAQMKAAGLEYYSLGRIAL
jgi:UDPglucose 6-dehydrogenase